MGMTEYQRVVSLLRDFPEKEFVSQLIEFLVHYKD